DESARAEWMQIVESLVTPGRPLTTLRQANFFEALVQLHRGRLGEALTTLSDDPEELVTDYNSSWRPWYAALWAESAVLAGHPDAADRMRRAGVSAAETPVGTAAVRRAAGLAAIESGDTARGRDEIVAAASALHALSARYLWARTLVMLGGPDEVEGLAELAD